MPLSPSRLALALSASLMALSACASEVPEEGRPDRDATSSPTHADADAAEGESVERPRHTDADATPLPLSPPDVHESELPLDSSSALDSAPGRDAPREGAPEADIDDEHQGGDSNTAPGPEREASPQTFDLQGTEVTLIEEPLGEGLKRYTLSTEAALLPGAPSSLSVAESPGEPRLRSGDSLIDALFALALVEAKENAVNTLSDGSFSQPESCECYTTGALWSWVWTRDIAYAVDLGLAWLDPERAKASLSFKLSAPKDGGSLQIVQDTGSGGSWPVSTDRAVWARGASALFPFLTPDDPFVTTALEAMSASAALDRTYAFDHQDGLYRGETSFLDWREQSYPTWTAQDTVHIAMSKALSTNLAHLSLLRALGDPKAEALEVAIEEAFWDGSRYRSYLGTALDASAPERWDLLGTALAVLDLGTHPEVLSTYPFAPGGPPVFWPQQPFTPIYHNRATWPFVTAYAALAAREAKNAAVFDASLASLVHGAAKHLSHMESYEHLSGAVYVDDGPYSGPVINSRRQLWSVAGFLGAIVRGVFGLEASEQGVRFTPFITDASWDGATLHNFPFQGGLINVTLSLSAGEEPTWLSSGDVTIKTSLNQGGTINDLDISAWQNIYAPQEPSFTLEGTTLTFSGEAGTRFELWADGSLIDDDAQSPYQGQEGVCYAIRAVLEASGTRSQPTAPQCTWPPGAVLTYDADLFEAQGGTWSTQYGRPHFESWGEPGDTLKLSITPGFSGRHLLQSVYGNGAGPVDTGITCALKWLQVHDAGGVLIGEGPLVMPQTGGWGEWRDSSVLSVELEAGVPYELTLSDGYNMSHLAHYTSYAGAGGGSAPYNFVNITQLKVLFRPLTTSE